MASFFKKRKGLRQGGKEGLKTSARNPLFATTPSSGKKFASIVALKIILLKSVKSCCLISILGNFSSMLAKVFKFMKINFLRYGLFLH
jgi:hypothetical protein